MHTQNFVHQDIKPSNIGLTENNAPILLDLGSARDISEQDKETTRLTTTRFAARQHLKGEPLHPCFDIYNLAITVYECLTKIKPLSSEERYNNKKVAEIDPLTPLCDLLQSQSEFVKRIDQSLALDTAQIPQTIDHFMKGWSSEENGLTQIKPSKPKPLPQTITTEEPPKPTPTPRWKSWKTFAIGQIPLWGLTIAALYNHVQQKTNN